jgi:hypothetical protein
MFTSGLYKIYRDQIMLSGVGIEELPRLIFSEFIFPEKLFIADFLTVSKFQHTLTPALTLPPTLKIVWDLSQHV